MESNNHMSNHYDRVRSFFEAIDIADPPKHGENMFSVPFVVNKMFEKIVKAKRTSSEPARLLENRTNPKPAAVPTCLDVWIFGYGSLVWKADFPFIDLRKGFITGYQRRFYQNSVDHRGTPEKPGRVVTLIPTSDAANRVYGVAYRIAARQKTEVLSHLDYREKNGYERHELKFQVYPEGKCESFTVITYIATHQNESYAGDVWEVPSIADQIFNAAGVSGRNLDYVLQLGRAMRVMFPTVRDEHLDDVELELLLCIQKHEALLKKDLKEELYKLIAKVGRANIAIGEAVEQFHCLKCVFEKQMKRFGRGNE